MSTYYIVFARQARCTVVPNKVRHKARKANRSLRPRRISDSLTLVRDTVALRAPGYSQPASVKLRHSVIAQGS